LDFKKSQGFSMGQTRPEKHAFFEKIHAAGEKSKSRRPRQRPKKRREPGLSVRILAQ
jgi:hypothetical protein